MTTSIHQACLEGNIRMVENLINNDHHAIHSKDEVKKTDLVESFFSPNTYPTNFKDERTPLHWACSGNKPQIVDFLCDKGVLVDAEDESGWTPLHIAASVGSKDCVLRLLTAKANINSQNSTGNTPAHYAASKNHTDVFDLLVSHGANMSLTNEMFQTPLHRAATLGHLPIVKKLISDEAGSANSGVKINAKDKMWNTPLHLACESGHGDVAAWLLQSNADAELENKDKQTPLDLIPEHNKQMKTYIQKLIQG